MDTNMKEEEGAANSPAAPYTVDFSQLHYNELALPFTPSPGTLRICIGKRGKHMIHISKKTNVDWIYYKHDRNAFEMYGVYDAESDSESDEEGNTDDANGGARGDASGIWADFELAKQMILNHFAFKILHRHARKHCAPDGAEVCWASEYIKTLPVRATYSVPCWKPPQNPDTPTLQTAPLPPLPVPEPVWQQVDASIRTTDWLPNGYTLRYDPDTFGLATAQRLPNGEYGICASDDFAWSTTTMLIQHRLAKAVVLGNPTTPMPLHLHQWALQYMHTYGGV